MPEKHWKYYVETPVEKKPLVFEVSIHKLAMDVEKFYVNGKFANRNDFGTILIDDEKTLTEDDPAFMFISAAPTDEVLAKYGIDHAEYAVVAAKLEELLVYYPPEPEKASKPAKKSK